MQFRKHIKMAGREPVQMSDIEFKANAITDSVSIYDIMHTYYNIVIYYVSS